MIKLRESLSLNTSHCVTIVSQLLKSITRLKNYYNENELKMLKLNYILYNYIKLYMNSIERQ